MGVNVDNTGQLMIVNLVGSYWVIKLRGVGSMA